MQTDVLVAVVMAGTAAVVVLLRGARLGGPEFFACAGLLLVAILLVGSGRSRREGFFDSAADTMRERLFPKVELLARSFHSAEKEEDTSNIEQAAEKDGGGDGGGDVESDEVHIDDKFFKAAGTSASIIDALKLQYKRISFFLCNLKQADAERYNKLVSLFSTI
jgi:hypothetical protein